MKFKINMSNEALKVVNSLVQFSLDLDVSTNSEEANAVISIVQGITSVFHNRYVKMLESRSLFNSKNKVSITFKYHELWALRNYLSIVFSTIQNEFEKVLIQSFINELDQKLK